MNTVEALERLKGSLLIDKYQLDGEVVQQPVLYQEVADQLSLSVSYRDTAKRRLAEKEAEVAVKIRKVYKDSKPRLTDRQVQEHVATSDIYVEAYKKFLRYKYLTSKWEALRNAYEQRAVMLRVLASLISANYYSSDSISTGATLASAGRQAMSRQRQQLKESRNEAKESKRKKRGTIPF